MGSFSMSLTRISTMSLAIKMTLTPTESSCETKRER